MKICFHVVVWRRLQCHHHSTWIWGFRCRAGDGQRHYISSSAHPDPSGGHNISLLQPQILQAQYLRKVLKDFCQIWHKPQWGSRVIWGGNFWRSKITTTLQTVGAQPRWVFGHCERGIRRSNLISSCLSCLLHCKSLSGCLAVTHLILAWTYHIIFSALGCLFMSRNIIRLSPLKLM